MADRRHIMATLAMLAVAALLTLTSAGMAHAETRIALVIGNATYKETTPLNNTTNDATDVSAALKRLGFDVMTGLDLDKRGMERLIREFDRKLSGADVALFFYAGHGLQIGGQNYLVPTDARLAAEGDVDFESLPLSLILRRMEREARTSLVLLDACRDNPLARNLARSMGTRSTSVGKGLAEVRTGIGTLIAFSTQPGNVALDGTARNSPYTTALLKHIEVPGRDMLSSLAAVRGEVVAATNGMQVPWEHTSLLGPVVLKAGALAATAPASQGSAADTTAANARRNWDVVKDSSSARELELFAERYAGTFFADLARARAEDLKARERTKIAAAAAVQPAAPSSATSPRHAPAPQDPGQCASRRAPDGGRYCVSSILKPQFGNSYGPEHLFDGDQSTAWVHGTRGPGIGANITIIFDRPRTVRALSVVNGYAKNPDIFTKNTRVRTLHLSFSNGDTATLTLPDDHQRRSIALPKPVEAQWVRLRIGSVYAGARYTDTAISELQVE